MVEEVPPGMRPHPESFMEFRVPSGYTRCRRARCQAKPVADLLRQSSHVDPRWWAYCAKHLAEYNREVRDGVVWWRGPLPAPKGNLFEHTDA